ncbi:UNVERIFIED_CONTAM: hypothetical protein H355_013106 [Colinus virginianus]|nr:hypothetical protein H355_013106 [Colinus virginianus]
MTDDEHDLSDREVDLDESADLSDIHWHDKSADSVLSPHPSSNLSLPLAQPVRSERSGRDTPASVDSIPLEWDHDYDLSRDLETAVSQALHSEEEDGEQDKDFYLRGAASIAGKAPATEFSLRKDACYWNRLCTPYHEKDSSCEDMAIAELSI